MIAIISDVHGNYPALQAVVAEIEKYNCRAIVSLGDVAGYYCLVNECIDLLRAKGVLNVLGNHDHYLINNERCPRSESANILLDFQREIISRENFGWLLDSKETYLEGDASFVHGGWDDPLDEYIHSVTEEYFLGRGARYFFSGHTHVQTLKLFERALYCNPGSVGQPRDGDSRAAFALFDGEQVRLMRVEYNVEAMAEAMKVNGFDAYFYKGLFSGVKIGHKVK